MDLEENKSPPSLQDLCCSFVSENVPQFSEEQFDELSIHCLLRLAYNFSLYDVLMFESFFKRRGVNTTHLINTIQINCLGNLDTYPIRSTTLPHLLRVTTENAWDSAFSRLLYRRVLVPVLEEHGAMLRKGEWTDNFLENVSKNHPNLHQLFLPRHQMWNDPLGPDLDISHDTIIQFCALAANKILFTLIDLNFCDFLLNPIYSNVLSALCQTLGSASILVRSNTLVLDMLDRLRANSKSLDRICLYCLKASDMRYFDEIVSRCSGVAGYYETNVGSKEKDVIQQRHFCYYDVDKVTSDRCEEFRLARCRELWSDEKLSQMEGGIGRICPALTYWKPQVPPKTETDSQEEDLMDEAILGDLQLPSEDDSYDGVSSLIIKTTNLVTRDLYVSVLDHHFKHWLALTQLDFGAPCVDTRMAESLRVLIKRQTFKSLAISAAEITADTLGELLICIATFRKVPMDEVMLISLQQSESIMDNLRKNRVAGRNEAEAHEYIDEYRSQTLENLSGFRGTKVFEISDCSLDIQTQCLVRQYIIADTAIEQLFVGGSVERLFFRSALQALANSGRRLTHFVLEDCCLYSQEDCMSLTLFLETTAATLVTLGMRSSFCFRDRVTFVGATQAIGGCIHLKSLDMAANMLARNIPAFVQMMYASSSSLKEICFRENSINPEDSIQILRWFADLADEDSSTLDILDLRGNQFVNADVPRYQDLIERATRRLLCDDGESVMA